MDERAHDVGKSGGRRLGEALEVRRSNWRGVVRSEPNAAIDHCVRCDEIHWMDSETAAESVICGESESPSSWTSWRRRIRQNHPDAYRCVVDPPTGSYSCPLRSGHRPVIATYEGYST